MSAKRAVRTRAEPAGGKVLAPVCGTKALQIEEWYASNVRLCRPGREGHTKSHLTAVLTDSLLTPAYQHGLRQPWGVRDESRFVPGRPQNPERKKHETPGGGINRRAGSAARKTIKLG